MRGAHPNAIWVSHEHLVMDKPPELGKHRHKGVSQRATIVGLDGSPMIACVVFDLSEADAILIMPRSIELPAEFNLVFSRNNQVHRQCSIAWRSSNTIGVRFVQQNEQSRLAPVGV